VEIIDLNPYDIDKIHQTAQLLFEGFSSWPTFQDAMKEVSESLNEGKVNRVAIDSTDQVVGWIAGNSQYDGNVWELHPLVVGIQHRMKGIGRALVSDFEEYVNQKGALTIILGADDEDGRTTLQI
jgi:aminoglycoside 6'-N-acetyltransferase I